MEKIIYPLLYYKLANEAVLGILVGTEYQAVDKDLKSVKATLSEYLQRQYKKHDIYPYMDILMPHLRTLSVAIRPTYREQVGAFPLSKTIDVPVVAVYGDNSTGTHECYLPLMGESFYYHDTKEFTTLVTHFAKNYFNQLAPDALYRYLLHTDPQLDTISLKVNYHRDFNWETPVYQRSFPNLERVAQPYPHKKSQRKQMVIMPQAAWELEDKVSEVIEKVTTSHANVLLIGEHGVGKSAVLQQAIKKMVSNAKKQQQERTFWQVRAQRITATAKYLGQWQENVQKIISELIASSGVLWVIDFIRLLQIGGDGAEDSVAAFMISYLQTGKLQLIGEVTPSELDSVRRLLPGFVENFQIVMIPELPEHKVFAIMDQLAAYSHKNLKITLSQDALQLSYRLLLRYFPYESFPGKAMRFLSKCISVAKTNKRHAVEQADVIQNFVEQTGLPELFLRDDQTLSNDELRQYFEQKIIGQPSAIEHLTGVVKIFKAGLNNPHKPISTMVFAGPTGVGKTASAKALAQYFFGKGQKRSPLIRIDMSEFQHPGQLARFIGIGNQVGKLVQEIRERPFSVLLLDEVEKASPVIFDALLTVLDEGKMVDTFGRVTNFKNTIIIMTTNLGASNQKSLGFNTQLDDASAYLSAIGKHFRPEFINRIDSIVSFNALTADAIRKITAIELNAVCKRDGFVKKGLQLIFSERVVEKLADAGFDERYGARPLQRAVEDLLVEPLAKWLLENEAVTNCKLYVDYEHRLVVSKER